MSVKFIFNLSSDNASVETPEMARQEAFDCLGRVARQIQEGRSQGAVLDVNGNRIGDWSLEDEED